MASDQLAAPFDLASIPVYRGVEQWNFFYRSTTDTLSRIAKLVDAYSRQCDYLRTGTFSAEVDRNAMIRQRAQVALVDLQTLIAETSDASDEIQAQFQQLLAYFKQQAGQ